MTWQLAYLLVTENASHPAGFSSPLDGEATMLDRSRVPPNHRELILKCPHTESAV